jgi:hypothetical protein
MRAVRADKYRAGQHDRDRLEWQVADCDLEESTAEVEREGSRHRRRLSRRGSDGQQQEEVMKRVFESNDDRDDIYIFRARVDSQGLPRTLTISTAFEVQVAPPAPKNNILRRVPGTLCPPHLIRIHLDIDTTSLGQGCKS